MTAADGERELLRRTVEDLLARHCTPARAAAAAAGAGWDAGLWQALEETGLTLAGSPEEAVAADLPGAGEGVSAVVAAKAQASSGAGVVAAIAAAAGARDLPSDGRASRWRGAVGRREGTPGTFGTVVPPALSGYCMAAASCSSKLDAAQLVGRGGRVDVPEKPDSGHIGTISITAQARRGGWNAMKPRIQRSNAVNPRFHGVRQQADLHDQLKLA